MAAVDTYRDILRWFSFGMLAVGPSSSTLSCINLLLNNCYWFVSFSFLADELARFFSLLFVSEYFFGNGALDFFDTELLLTGLGCMFKKYEHCLGLLDTFESKLNIFVWPPGVPTPGLWFFVFGGGQGHNDSFCTLRNCFVVCFVCVILRRSILLVRGFLMTHSPCFEIWLLLESYLWKLLLLTFRRNEFSLALTLVKRFFFDMNSNPCDFGGMFAAIGMEGLFFVVAAVLSNNALSIPLEGCRDLNGF